MDPKAEMLAARSTRPAPEALQVSAPAWRAETLRWLFVAEPFEAFVDRTVLERQLDDVLAGPFDTERGFARDGRYWLEDQAAIAHMCLAAGSTRADALAQAAALLETVLDAYTEPRDGALHRGSVASARRGR